MVRLTDCGNMQNVSKQLGSLDCLDLLMTGRVSGTSKFQSIAHQWSKRLRYTLGILISVLCLGLIAWRIDIDEVLIAIRDFEWIWLALGIASLAAGYFLRV